MTKTPERDWRDSNAPQWAKDAAQREIDAYRLTAALSWPMEAKPEPVGFHWGEYDHLYGEPVPGTYWTANVKLFQIKENDGTIGESWKKWVFRDLKAGYRSDTKWTTRVRRGPLFTSERDARLYLLWAECEKAATHLMKIKKRLQLSEDV